MAKEKNFDALDRVAGSASLHERKGEDGREEKGKPVMKKKLISIDIEVEKRIKNFSSGSVNSFISLAIAEKMKREGI